MSKESQAAPRPRLRLNPFLWAFLLGIGILTLMRPCLRRVPDPPAVQGRLPGFAFVDAAGGKFGPERLRGAVWIINFFYIACGTDCSGQMGALGEIRRAYADLKIDGIHVLSLSVDPARDTSENLRTYEARQGADPDHWLLATGGPADLEAFARDVFGPPAGVNSGTSPDPGTPPGAPEDPPLGWLARSGRVVLVDPEGGLRGSYATDAAGIDELYNRAQHVRDLYRDHGGRDPARGR